MTQTIKDLIVLGRSAPEPIEKDGRHTVCLAGWSDSMDSFIRLYPTKMETDIRRWSKIKVPVEKDTGNDPREESYKIEGSQEDWDELESKIVEKKLLDKRERIKLAERLKKTCPSQLNQNNMSLGIVAPEIHKCYLKDIEKDDRKAPIQHLFEDRPLKSKRSYPQRVRVKYTCQNCKTNQGYHDQQCMEWGIYRYWEKNQEDDPAQVIENLHIKDDNYKILLVIGNMKVHLSRFVVISVLRFKKEELWKGNTFF